MPFLPGNSAPALHCSRRQSHAQLVAAFEPPSAQHCPPVGRCRSGTEAVDTRAAALFGLICSFNHFSITCCADYMFSEFRKSSESGPNPALSTLSMGRRCRHRCLLSRYFRETGNPKRPQSIAAWAPQAVWIFGFAGTVKQPDFILTQNIRKSREQLGVREAFGCYNGVSILDSLFKPKWRNGRRAGLKNRWGRPRVSSTLTFGTTLHTPLVHAMGCLGLA